jgi:hypothetical protein
MSERLLKLLQDYLFPLAGREQLNKIISLLARSDKPLMGLDLLRLFENQLSPLGCLSWA